MSDIQKLQRKEEVKRRQGSKNGGRTIIKVALKEAQKASVRSVSYTQTSG